MGKHKLYAALTAAVLSLVFISGCSNNEGSKISKPEAMRNITSSQLVSEMKIGWNLGNTLDVCAADRDGDGNIDESPESGQEVDETLWGNIPAQKELFTKLKGDGINAVRIPVTWRDHIDNDNGYKIDSDWMNRVEEVVNYAYSQEMYVIINIHHDGGDDAEFGAWVKDAANDYDGFLKKYKAVWTQISDRFKNYSDKLIFESMNEVGFDKINKNSAYNLLNTINQEFVNLIRKSGGNNPKRHLLIAGYWTDVDKTCDPLFKMPEDSENRLILSVHYYTPWEFCTTTVKHKWGTPSETKLMYNKMDALKENFVDNGVPVIIGEYGTGSGNEKESCIYFCELLTKICNDYGIAAFLWDNGAELNRTTLQWKYPEMISALQRAISGDDYTPEKIGVSYKTE